MLHAVIMAGGSGTRFWPASRNSLPKQLLKMLGDRTMLQSTADRVASLIDPSRMLVVTNHRLFEPIREQLPRLSPAAVIGEPCKRDTAPCIGLAALWMLRSDPEAIMLVMPSDHVIRTDEESCDAARHAVALVDRSPDLLVTFGIRPTYPAESFGYIERGEPMDDISGGPPTYRVRRFREKPERVLAEEYLALGNYYWNSGIFVWRARRIVDELTRREPEMIARLQTIVDAVDESDFDEVFRREFEAIRPISIDYAVMENAERVAVIEAPFQWDDLGSWQAMARLYGTDEQGNTLVGRCLTDSTRGTIVRGHDNHLIVTIGLEDCIVVHTPDATLVAAKDQEERVREIVRRLQEEGLDAYL